MSYVKRLVGILVVPIRNKMMIDSRVEAEVANHKGAILPDLSSPERGLFNPKKSIGHAPPMSLRILPSMFRLLRPMRNNIANTIKSLPENPSDPKTLVEESTLKEVEEYAKSMGAGAIGYCKLDPKYIFQDKAVIHENVIVLSEEMDKDDLETAPSPRFQKEVLRTYNSLGIITNKVTDFLRSKGFSAQASHPLGGVALYPPLAILAGMGTVGMNGLLIGPEFGPRHRLSAIFTSIENLPFVDKNDHEWVEEYCKSCQICVKECPGEAIYGEPKVHENGSMTYIEDEKCFPPFYKQHGCSVCIKVCPFNRIGYEKV
ncbi:MAG: 4Fe-4S double cluster binding domain-containing protein, partial [Candidatus Hodarchaeota archaeon]